MALKGIMARGVQGMTNGAAASMRSAGLDGAAQDQTAAPTRPTLAQAAGPRTVAPSTSVDATSELEGRLRCKETLRIDGRIVGEIECDKSVIIGQGARVHASIEADEVQVSGIVEGDITARRKVTLDRTAVVVGDLTTPGIVIEEGAKLKGRILIGSDAEAEDTVAKARNGDAAKADGAGRTEAPGAKEAEATPKTAEPTKAASADADRRSGDSKGASAKKSSGPKPEQPAAATA